MKISDLAGKLDITEREVHKILRDMGEDLPMSADIISDRMAEQAEKFFHRYHASTKEHDVNAGGDIREAKVFVLDSLDFLNDDDDDAPRELIVAEGEEEKEKEQQAKEEETSTVEDTPLQDVQDGNREDAASEPAEVKKETTGAKDLKTIVESPSLKEKIAQNSARRSDDKKEKNFKKPDASKKKSPGGYQNTAQAKNTGGNKMVMINYPPSPDKPKGDTKPQTGGKKNKYNKNRPREEAIIVEAAPVLLDGERLPSFPVPLVLTIKEFADAVKQPVQQVMMQMMKSGFMMNMNENLDFETMALIADEMNIDVHLVIEEEIIDFHDQTLDDLLSEDKEHGKTRPPVVSVMGHVDHGKTSLLDTIRKANVVSTESGGITQSIGAYQVQIHDRPITFIDTPGHEAFISMRKRGVRATDVAILVVAANDGVKSQTKEALSHAKEAGVPVVVAITKADLPDTNIEKVKTELTEIGLLPEEWGGETMMIQVSSKTGEGIESLLESVLLLSDILDLKAQEQRFAVASVIESNLDAKLGKTATVLIHTGTLNIRDIVVVGDTYGRVRFMQNDRGEEIESALPSQPVLISGLNEVPDSGELLRVVATEKEARRLADLGAEKVQKRKNTDVSIVQKGEHEMKGIRVVLKADTIGSLEAIKESLSKIKTENAKIKIIRARTGDIVQSDIQLAEVTDAYVIGFNADFASPDVKEQANARNIRMQKYSVIYKLAEDLTEMMLTSIEPEFENIDLGVMKVKKIFLTEKDFLILGGRVTDGHIEPNVHVKVIKNGAQVSTGEVVTVQRGPSKVDRVDMGDECGLEFRGKYRVQEGDELHFFKTIQKEIILG